MLKLILFTVCAISFCLPASAQFWKETEGFGTVTHCLVSNSKGWVFAGAENSSVYRTKDLGKSWERFNSGLEDGGPNFYTVSSLSLGVNDELFATMNGKGLFKSTNDGETWVALPIDLTPIPNARIVASTKVIGTSTKIFLLHDGGPKYLYLRMSNDGGATFSTIPVTGLPSAISSLFFTFMSPNSNKLFVSVAYNKGLYRSTNEGINWTRIDSDPNSGESDDNFLTMAAAPNGDLYVGRNSLAASTKSQNACILRSKDDGSTWTYLLEGWDKSNITNNKVTGIAFGLNNVVYATTEKSSGTFYSTNNGDSWVSQNEGLASNGAKAVIVTNRNHAFLAEPNPVIYSHIDPTMGVQDVRTGENSTHVVSPLPGKTEVNITVSTEMQASLRLQVFSTQGAVLMTDFKRGAPAGVNSFSVDVSGLANGIYGYQLMVNGVPTGGTFIVSHD